MLSLFDEYIKNSQLYFYAITIIIALIKYSKYFDTPLKFFPILLMYTFLNELLGYFINNDPTFLNPFLKDFFSNTNIMFYNIYNIIFVLYFVYIFWHYSNSKLYKKTILYFGFSFIIIIIINIFLQNFFTKQQILSFVCGSIILIICILLYLKENNKILRNKLIKHSLLFWISIGLLIFFTFYTPIKIYYCVTNFENMPLYRIIRRVHLSLICIMYGCFIYGFIQMKGKLRIEET